MCPSERTKTAGSTSSNYNHGGNLLKEKDVMYDLVQHHGGATGISIKAQRNNEASTVSLDRQAGHIQSRASRSNQLCSRRIEDVFAYKKDLLFRKLHTRKEVAASTKKWNAKYRAALLTVKYEPWIYFILNIEKWKKANKPVDIVQGAEDIQSYNHDKTYLLLSKGKKMGQAPVLNVFPHERNIQSNDGEKHLESWCHVTI